VDELSASAQFAAAESAPYSRSERLLDRPEAADAEPELVAGLRAVQAQRRRLRQSQ
jgi:hypothetical protein